MQNTTEEQLTGIQEQDTELMEVNERKWKAEFLKFIENKNRLAQKYMQMEEDLLHPIRKIGTYGKIWIGFLVAVTLAGIYAYYLQETRSKYETISIRDYTMWGVYISTFVFYVALSMVGALMSAILKLIKFEWYRPLSRIAELIALASIIMAGLCIMVAMGRPDRLHYLILYAKIQSPVTWDVIVIATYVAVSLLMLLVPILPCMKICEERLEDKPVWQKWLYSKLSFGWKGTPEQWKLLKKSIKILAILIIPLAVAIQTVDAWLFATTLRAEWDSTNFGVYFISGACLLASAAMIVAVYAFRKLYHFEKYLTDKHFDYMGKMLVFLSLCYFYTNVNEYLVPSYKMSGLHANHLLDLFTQDTAPLYWMVAVFGIIVPSFLPMLRSMRKPLPLTIIALLAVVAAWFKRYLIVIPGLSHPYLPIQDVPESWTQYSPSMVEMTIVTATFAALLLIITMFSRFVPIISIWQVAEGEGVDIQEIHEPLNKKKI
ncbi:MAG: NrfD/PsrC family molybdoenzyme membrane anchor subunit [Bacteroidota bacterium]|nr:NrfD/PsrC family molybdoenzyme membrane anchor subunit [Bacteroidota bacterium]